MVFLSLFDTATETAVRNLGCDIVIRQRRNETDDGIRDTGRLTVTRSGLEIGGSSISR